MPFSRLILVIQLKKTDYDTSIDEIEEKLLDHNDKYITTQEINNLKSENFAARL